MTAFLDEEECWHEKTGAAVHDPQKVGPARGGGGDPATSDGIEVDRQSEKNRGVSTDG